MSRRAGSCPAMLLCIHAQQPGASRYGNCAPEGLAAQGINIHGLQLVVTEDHACTHAKGVGQGG